MHKSTDSRPTRTANQLRLVVVVPVVVAVVGLGWLGAKRSGFIRELMGWSSPPPSAGQPGQPQPQRQVTARPPEPKRSNVGTAPTTAPSSRTTAAGSNSTSSDLAGEKHSPGAASASFRPVTPAVDEVARPLAAGLMGTVFLRGTPPPEKELVLDPACGALHSGSKPTTRFFVVGTNGGLADVVVLLEPVAGPRSWSPPTERIEIRQRGCEYLPYVTAAQVGQVIRVFNNDPLMHNVHPTPAVDGNKEQNKAQLPKGAPLDFIFAKPELFLRFKCDVHPWMFAYVTVAEHPFQAVSGAHGAFTLPTPPPGDYRLLLKHRKLDALSTNFTVHAGHRLVVKATFDLADASQSTLHVTEE